MSRVTARQLARLWGVDVRHSLYREDGIWFHRLKAFPGALFDSAGYIIFETAEGYQDALEGQIKQDVHVRNGIAFLPGYIQVIHEGKTVVPSPLERTSFEAARSKGRSLLEGKPIEVALTFYERDPLARAECLRHYGFRCSVCDLLLQEIYGFLGESFIHVHHLQPLSEIEQEHEIDPIRDLRPVCPNCHAMLHQRTPPVTIEELRHIVESHRFCARPGNPAQ